MNELQKNKKYDELVVNIENIVKNAKDKIATDINQVIIQTYWSIGRYIVEYEQGGNVKAEYGKLLLSLMRVKSIDIAAELLEMSFRHSSQKSTYQNEV